MATVDIISALKSGKWPKAGVHIRYYTHGKYKNLSKEEKNELREWRSLKGNANNKKKNNNFDVKGITAAVKKKMEAKTKEKMKETAASEQQNSKAEAFVISTLEKFAKSNSPLTSATSAPATICSTSFLNGILKKAKN